MAPLLVAWLVVGCEEVEDRPATWSYIHAAIIEPSCATASCHSQISSIAGRDMSTPENAYAVLTGRTCNAPSHPGEPPLEDVQYLFIDTLRGTGGRVLMPPEQQLPQAEIEIIERWYAMGAPCD